LDLHSANLECRRELTGVTNSSINGSELRD
jgi:hypothetical protein